MTHQDRIRANWHIYNGDLVGALTILEVAEIWHKHIKTVIRAIDTGALFAIKKDAPISIRGGVWLISFQSASDLWGDPISRIKDQYNHVEFRGQIAVSERSVGSDAEQH